MALVVAAAVGTVTVVAPTAAARLAETAAWPVVSRTREAAPSEAEALMTVATPVDTAIQGRSHRVGHSSSDALFPLSSTHSRQ